MIEQAAACVEHTKTEKQRRKIFMQDNDGKYSKPSEIFPLGGTYTPFIDFHGCRVGGPRP